VLSSVTTRTPNSEMPTVLPLAARQQAKWTNPQAAYAMTTQMSPMFQGMSLPVSTLAWLRTMSSTGLEQQRNGQWR
jgi:hypothetical protein